MDILLQSKSTGIRYEGYDEQFIQCVFEDADVSGRSERYEYRCRPDLQCCGRQCCIPGDTAIPIWLMTLFVALGLLFLCALIGTILWLLKRRKQEDIVDKSRQVLTCGNVPADYQSYKQDDWRDQHLQHDDAYSTPNELGTDRRMQGHGYRNPLYKPLTTSRQDAYDQTDDSNLYDKAGAGTTETNAGLLQSSQRSELEPLNRVAQPSVAAPAPYMREVVEEKFEQNFHIEEQRSPNRESREFL